MVKVLITRDHGPWKKGTVVTLDWWQAFKAGWHGWAKPIGKRETAVSAARETR